jgi:Uma2 family endonuclease
MGEPARKAYPTGSGEPEPELVDDDGVVLLQRWIERPDGHLELLEIPLTPEDFLDPQLEDTMVQGLPHSRIRRYFAEILDRHFQTDEDVMILEDVKHLFGPGLPGPAPDVSVIRGALNPDDDLQSFDILEQGVVPCLVIEVVSPFDARIRRTDEVDKVSLYQRIGIPEYLLVDLPRRGTGRRFRVRGYRLSPAKRYQAIEPDDQGYLLSETTQLRFGVPPKGDRVDIFDVRTGERLRTPLEEEEGRKAAEKEIQRLHAEIERLRKPEPDS